MTAFYKAIQLLRDSAFRLSIRNYETDIHFHQLDNLLSHLVENKRFWDLELGMVIAERNDKEATRNQF
jgi:hypothetical protein